MLRNPDFLNMTRMTCYEILISLTQKRLPLSRAAGRILSYHISSLCTTDNLLLAKILKNIISHNNPSYFLYFPFSSPSALSIPSCQSRFFLKNKKRLPLSRATGISSFIINNLFLTLAKIQKTSDSHNNPSLFSIFFHSVHQHASQFLPVKPVPFSKEGVISCLFLVS